MVVVAAIVNVYPVILMGILCENLKFKFYVADQLYWSRCFSHSIFLRNGVTTFQMSQSKSTFDWIEN